MDNLEPSEPCLIPAEDFDRVQAELAALEKQHMPAVFPQLDATLQGGLRLGELTAIMGPTQPNYRSHLGLHAQIEECRRQLAAGEPLFPDLDYSGLEPDFSMVSEEKLADYTEAESRAAARLCKGLAHRYGDSKFRLVSRRVQVEPNVSGDGL